MEQMLSPFPYTPFASLHIIQVPNTTWKQPRIGVDKHRFCWIIFAANLIEMTIVNIYVLSKITKRKGNTLELTS